jgi:uncharacterized membrane protein YfcA
LLFGLLVGFSLGLTGGGGSVFAIPLLVYGLAIPVHQAVVISLAAVGAIAWSGAVIQLHRGRAEVKSGLIFALAGVGGTPVGVWLGIRLPSSLLLSGFALLMLYIAIRLWRQASRDPTATKVIRAGIDDGNETLPTCQRDPQGILKLTSRCALLLVTAGILTGLLSGLFGVGGGFLIVPALVFVASLPIQRAVATSLLVIAIISSAGFISHILAGQLLALKVAAWFVVGGLAGMGLGIKVGHQIAGPLLQKAFASLMITVAAFMLIRDFL